MRCITYGNATEFLERNEAALLLSETEHNLILGLANSLAEGQLPDGDALFLSVLRDGEPVGHAVRTNVDKPMALSKMPYEAAATLAEFIFDQKIALTEVVGPIEGSQGFVDTWEAITGSHSQLRMHLGVYELDRVVFPEPDGRNLVPIRDVHPVVVLEYILGFLSDSFPDEEDPNRLAAEMADWNLKNDTLYFWQGPEDDQPVSMAARPRETRNAATLALVYTPPHLRNHGHASRIVAELSDRCLKSGKKLCNLFTDMQNPTSNSIYQKVGYRKLGESKHFKLSSPRY